jgi:hypothetical protein
MSYIIHSPNKVLFIHIPKTAGNAIMTVANKIYGTTQIRNDRTKNRNYHSTLKDAEKHFKNFDNLYSFTVVRNPWSRISSWYFFRKTMLTKVLKTSKHSKKVSRPLDEVRKEYELMQHNFDKWLYFYYDQPWDHTWFSLAHNQIYWLKNSKINITNIIKYEELASGFSSIPIFKNQQLPITNRSRSSSVPYKQLYSNKSRKFVAKIYQEDIDNFKYTF